MSRFLRQPSSKILTYGWHKKRFFQATGASTVALSSMKPFPVHADTATFTTTTAKNQSKEAQAEAAEKLAVATTSPAQGPQSRKQRPWWVSFFVFGYS